MLPSLLVALVACGPDAPVFAIGAGGDSGQVATPGSPTTSVTATSATTSTTTGTTSTETSPPTDELLQRLVDDRCFPCHVQGGDSGGMALDDVRHAVGVPSVQVPTLVRVAPGDLDGSYLWQKIGGTHLAVGGSGQAMPPDDPLASHELADFQRWILDLDAP